VRGAARGSGEESASLEVKRAPIPHPTSLERATHRSDGDGLADAGLDLERALLVTGRCGAFGVHVALGTALRSESHRGSPAR